MKRRAPLRRSPLESRSPVQPYEPGRREFKTLSNGTCECCGARGVVLRHHVVTERRVRAAGGDPWDKRNSVMVGVWSCVCHAEHHSRARPIPLSKLPSEAIVFASELLGAHQAADYLARHYSAG